MRALVITNPRATGVTRRQRDVVVHALSRETELYDGPDALNLAETANRGHAAALACRAMRDGVDLIVALGGDGTVNEVVNGMLTDGVHAGVPALGVVPAGSTNVFAQALGLPTDPIEATGYLLDALREDRSRLISVGRAENRFFVFAAGLGLDAAIVRDVEKQRGRGRESTHLLYARTGLRTYAAQDRRRPQLTVELPDGSVLGDVFFTIITNCDPWTFVGDRPIRPTPQASFDTGLDLYARLGMQLAGMLLGLTQVLRPHPRPRGRAVAVRHDLSGFVVRSAIPVPFQVDGDYLGDRESVQFWSVPGALTVMG